MGGLLYLNVGFLVNSSDGRVLTIRRSLVIPILLDPNFSTRVFFLFLFFFNKGARNFYEWKNRTQALYRHHSYMRKI